MHLQLLAFLAAGLLQTPVKATTPSQSSSLNPALSRFSTGNHSTSAFPQTSTPLSSPSLALTLSSETSGASPSSETTPGLSTLSSILSINENVSSEPTTPGGRSSFSVPSPSPPPAPSATPESFTPSPPPQTDHNAQSPSVRSSTISGSLAASTVSASPSSSSSPQLSNLFSQFSPPGTSVEVLPEPVTDSVKSPAQTSKTLTSPLASSKISPSENETTASAREPSSSAVLSQVTSTFSAFTASANDNGSGGSVWNGLGLLGGEKPSSPSDTTSTPTPSTLGSEEQDIAGNAPSTTTNAPPSLVPPLTETSSHPTSTYDHGLVGLPGGINGVLHVSSHTLLATPTPDYGAGGSVRNYTHRVTPTAAESSVIDDGSFGVNTGSITVATNGEQRYDSAPATAAAEMSRNSSALSTMPNSSGRLVDATAGGPATTTAAGPYNGTATGSETTSIDDDLDANMGDIGATYGSHHQSASPTVALNATSPDSPGSHSRLFSSILPAPSPMTTDQADHILVASPSIISLSTTSSHHGLIGGTVNGILSTHSATATTEAGSSTNVAPNGTSPDSPGSLSRLFSSILPAPSPMTTDQADHILVASPSAISLSTTSSHHGLIGGTVNGILSTHSATATTEAGSITNGTNATAGTASSAIASSEQHGLVEGMVNSSHPIHSTIATATPQAGKGTYLPLNGTSFGATSSDQHDMVEGSVNGFLPTHTATATAQAGNVTDALPDAASSDHGSGGVTSHELFPTHSATPTVNAGNTTGSSLNTTASHDGLIGGIVSSSLPSETDRGSFRNQTTSFFYPTATSGASLNKSMPISDGILPPPKSTGNLLPNATSPYLNVNATLPTTGSAASGPLLNLTTPSLSPHINVTHGLPKPTYSTSMPILSSPMPSANATIPSVSSSGGYPTLYPSGARNSSAGPKESGAFSNGTTIVPSPTSSARLSSIAADTVSTVSTVSTASTALKTSKTSPLASSSTSKVTIFTPASTSMSQTVTTKQTPSAHIDSTMTEMSVATSILTAPWSTSFAKTATPSATITSQAHAVVPDQITPPTPVPSAKGAVLIQIGFKPRFLPYYWIARNSDSINQIAKYVPLNLAEALNIPVTDTPFVAIDEWKEYHMALVRCYIPGDKLHNLSGQLHSFASPLFNSKEPPARALFQYVDPNVPLIPGEGGTPPVETTDSSFVMGPSKSGGGRSGSDGYGNSNNNGGGDSIDSNTNGPAGSGSSSQIHPRSVGIGLGVVAGAAVYGAAMFWIARRRRQGKNGDAAAAAAQNGAGRPGLDGSGGGHAGSSSAVTPGHNRVSSVTGRPYTEESSQMSMLSNGGVYAYYGPPPTLEETSRPSRASNRTTPAQISAPVRSANSLGWT